MLIRKFINPDNVWSRVQKTDECPEGELLYNPITLNIDKTRTFIYLAGQTARQHDGEVKSDDMREQLRHTCENIGICLNLVGATFDDVVTSKTYVLDLQEYYGVSDERFKYFKNNRPASTLLQISGLGFPKCKIEITVEAIIETDRLTIGY
jgi:enamine deaminase RidA (YjgF/YER057c/UK114 family)